MEGCDPSSADRRVLLVGATNRPEVRSHTHPLLAWQRIVSSYILDGGPDQSAVCLTQQHGLCPDVNISVLHHETHVAMQELDEAARRRMPKQLYIPLPCAAARRQMVDRQLGV